MLCTHWFVDELVSESCDGRIKNERNEKEEDEVANLESI
jgi:hypothetical protein